MARRRDERGVTAVLLSTLISLVLLAPHLPHLVNVLVRNRRSDPAPQARLWPWRCRAALTP